MEKAREAVGGRVSQSWRGSQHEEEGEKQRENEKGEKAFLFC